MRCSLRLVLPLALITGILVGCGSGSPSGGGDLSGKEFQNAQGKRSVTVEAGDNNFTPAYVEVSTGTTVKFEYTGRNHHNEIAVDNGFKSITRTFNTGDSVTVTFDKPGEYPYYCSLHGTPTRGMTGGIRVVE